MAMSTFLAEAEHLLDAIRNHASGSLELPRTESFMRRVHCNSLSAPNSQKSDIYIVVHDNKTSIENELGFSIKSRLGGDSTLLNASRATNFVFRITNADISDDEINEINAVTGAGHVINRVNKIREKGGLLTFDHIENRVFMDNLILLDGDLPRIIAHLLLKQIETKSRSVSDLTLQITESNPIGYNISGNSPQPFYEYKVKQFLTSVALGMVAATPWRGIYDANGGYLVIKEDGDLVCYHFYDRNRFEDYLFHRAYLERSSTSRHDYGRIYKEGNGQLFFNLNLQIRLR